MPNKENIRKWVEALRSGEYKQFKYGLTNDERSAFCCLGVACEVYRKETGLGMWSQNAFDGVDNILPESVSKFLGLHYNKFQSPIVRGDTLIQLNDSFGYDFNMIADLIEAEYLNGQ